MSDKTNTPSPQSSTSQPENDNFTFELSDASRMDPRTQHFLSTSGHLSEMVPISATVTNLDRWKNWHGIRHNVETYDPKHGQWLVTGRVPAGKIAELNDQDFVVNVKVGQPIFPASTPTNRSDPPRFSAPFLRPQNEIQFPSSRGHFSGDLNPFGNPSISGGEGNLMGPNNFRFPGGNQNDQSPHMQPKFDPFGPLPGMGKFNDDHP